MTPNPKPQTPNPKSGISLIAVLMFMLAATTASLVVFKWIGQENFASGARLKNSEAYQASQAGLEAVQGWLTNKGADAGALLTDFLEDGKPRLLCTDANCSSGKDLLGGMQSSRQQNFKVYLAGADVTKATYNLKFISEGTARDGSKYSQVGIFDVDGLYKTRITNPPNPNAKKVPPFFGIIRNTTQGNFESAYITGHFNSTSGISSKGDILITGNSYIQGSASGHVGCPSGEKPENNNRPSEYATLVAKQYYGNYYVREDLRAETLRFCGSVYVGGNYNVDGEQVIWGDLYVKGDLIINHKLFVLGNVTVEGNVSLSSLNLDIRGNLVMPTGNITINSPNDPRKADGIKWYKGTCTPNNNCNGFLPNSYTAGGTPPKGGDPLSYLGDQIKKTKNDDDIYTIPDPIMLGMVNNDWKDLAIPNTCTTLGNFANNTNTGENNSVITLSSSTKTTDLMNAINGCYNTGNWTGADGSKWLVLKFDWGGINNFQDEILDGNFIIIVTNKPSTTRLPNTTKDSKVLLYYTQGTTDLIYIGQAKSGYARNYFIYSSDNISKIDGSQHLTGNLFMADASELVTMSDMKIQANDALFEALSNAGVIKDNVNKCTGTGLEDPNNPGHCKDDKTPTCQPEDPVYPNCTPPSNDKNDKYHIPLTPHLKVALQSQYANKESVADAVNAVPSILVLPRVVHLGLSGNSSNNIKSYYKLLYLNGSTPMQVANEPTPNCPNLTINTSPEGTYTCSFAATAGISDFYVIVHGGGGLSSSSQSSSSVASSSSAEPSLTCTGLPPNGVAGAAITQPAVKCNGTDVNASNYSYIGAPASWASPAAGTYNISVTANSGTCDGKTASCGSIEVTSGTSNCYDPSWCGGIAWDDIKWGKDPKGNGSTNLGNGACVPVAGQNQGPSCSNKCTITSQTNLTWRMGTTYFMYFPINTNDQNYYGVQESGSTINKPSISCGGGVSSSSSSVPSSSSAALAITCTVAKTIVTQGENIGPPTITCSSGMLDKSAANFSGSTPTDVNNWKNTTGNAYYGTSVTGDKTIQVSNVKCDNVIVAGNTNCGTITVAKPTCTVSGSAIVGQTITPTVGCGSATKSGNPTFNGGNGWNSNNAGGGSYNSTGSKTISLSSVTCDGHSITNITGVSCGTVNVVASSSSARSSSSGAACAYQPSWCNGSPASATGVSTTPTTNSGACFFVSDVSTIHGVGIKINGNTPAGNNNNDTEFVCGLWGLGNCASLLPAKQDGGYYIYIGNWISNQNFTSGISPNCGGGNPTPSSSSGGGGGCATTTPVTTEAMFTPASGNCYIYTSCDGTVKACVDNNGPINMNVTCNGQNWSGNATGCWTDFFNCGNGNTVTINVTSNANNRTMKMNCW